MTRRRPVGFDEAVEDAQRLQGWTHAQIADQLAVSLSTVQSWLKIDARSARTAPPWAIFALTALSQGRDVTERRGGLEITYSPARK